MYVDPWYMTVFDAVVTMIAALGAIFGVVLVAWVLYRIVVTVGAAAHFVLSLIFGDHSLDGVPYYDADDYP